MHGLRILSTAAAALLLGGCVGGGPSPSDPTAKAGASAKAPDSTAAWISAPVAFSGTTGRGACVVAVGQTQCQFVDPGQNFYAELRPDGTAARVTGNVTWSAATQLSARLNAYLLVDKGGGFAFEQGYPVVQGVSPLKVEFSLAKYAQHRLAVGVSSIQRTTDGDAVFVMHSTPQAFEFAGMVHAVLP